jgi:hypothetical protein
VFASHRKRLGMRSLIFLTLVFLIQGTTGELLKAHHLEVKRAEWTPTNPTHPVTLAALIQSPGNPTLSGLDNQALAEDLQAALEQIHSRESTAPVINLKPVKLPSVEEVKSALKLKEKGFHFVKAEALSSSENTFLVFVRHEDPKRGKELAEEVLNHLSEKTFPALPQNVTARESFSPSSSVVIALNFLTSEKPYPLPAETAVNSTIKSPFGFHNDVRGVRTQGTTTSVHLQEYFVPLFDVLHWSATTPAQVAELITINNSLGSEGSLYASVSASFGATMAFLAPYLKVTTAEFFQGTSRLLKALRDSQNMSKTALNQELCPSPTDYFIMASDLRPTFHNMSGRNMAFVSHDFDQDIYTKWLILSQIFSLAAKPLVIEDCGWPANMTDDFRRTVSAWWNQMTVIGSDQKTFQQAKFLCEQ